MSSFRKSGIALVGMAVAGLLVAMAGAFALQAVASGTETPDQSSVPSDTSTPDPESTISPEVLEALQRMEDLGPAIEPTVPVSAEPGGEPVELDPYIFDTSPESTSLVGGCFATSDSEGTALPEDAMCVEISARSR